ncbi:MAG: phospho-sugar mutase [Candidatus Nanopelagicales bacterium]|nr:phospho-sugar mutase [Candidatus Nanopelagicales bacterium]
MNTVREQAQAWLAEDPDPQTRAELQAWLDADDQARLSVAFAGPLTFGTAGLRGPLGPGPAAMNHIVVAKAAAGLCQYVKDIGGSKIVIGYDARRNSEAFAELTAAIAAGAGLQAEVLPRRLPTPVLAYAIKARGADAGVVVTASHNPPEDNGYKVYLGDGMQIVSPADAEISARIAVQPAFDQIPQSAQWTRLDDAVVDAYLDRVVGLADPANTAGSHLTVVYSAMHGVGGGLFETVCERLGFVALHPVAEQFEPDPGFPTVAFPNPEEPGAMDLALATAERVGADLIIANDPDADRCAVGIPDGSGFRMLRGDEVGVLLGWWTANRAPVSGSLVTTIVSSSMLSAVAHAAGLGFQQTLTGFKWITRPDDIVFGYEEALGYCVDPEAVRDKDGISASVRMLELAAHLAGQGKTIADQLDALAAEHGVYLTDQISIRVQDLSDRDRALAALAARPGDAIADLAGVEDLTDTAVTRLPPTEGLRLLLGGGGRVVARPSGTEAKLKVYLEVVEHTGDLARDRANARSRMDVLRGGLERFLADT